MKYVLIGKIVNTHGLKGEVRILSDFRYKEKVFKSGMNIYIGKNKINEVICSYRHHKIFDMIVMNGYNDINEVLKYKGEYVFVNREDILLGDNEFLDEDIIGMEVYMGNNYVGVVKRIDKHSKNELLVVKNGEKCCYIPYNFGIINDVNMVSRRINVKEISGLVDSVKSFMEN